MIVGITGRPYAGKTSLAKLFWMKNFRHYSFGEVVLEEAVQRNTEPIREKLLFFENMERQNSGRAIWAERVIGKITGNEDTQGFNYVIDDFGYPDQVESFINTFGRNNFYLVAIDASETTRYQRMLEILKKEDNEDSYREFKAIDSQYWDGHLRKNGRNVSDCFKIADRRIINEGTPLDLYHEMLGLLEHLGLRRRVE